MDTAFQFGLLADCQFADKDDTHVEGRTQRLRQSACCLQAAVAAFNERAGDLSFVLTLGDIIDGNVSEDRTLADFDEITGTLDLLAERLDAVHVIGNHCLSAGRHKFLERLCQPSCYRQLQVAPGWHLILLDTTEVSGHSGYPADSEMGLEAVQYLAAHPLSDAEPHMSPWNGGISRQQLRWLEVQLADAAGAGDRCLIAAHHQVGKGAARHTHMAWNHEAIKEVLLASPSFVAFFAGHDHMGGYSCIDGRHFVTLEAMLEAPEGGNAFAFVSCGNGRLQIDGQGSVTSRTLGYA